MKQTDELKKKSVSRVELDAALLDNFVHLQKVLTNLALKFDQLASNISRLLELFELSAKNFAEKAVEKGSVDQEFLKKLDALLDQNKTISKGIMMMEEKVRNRMENVPPAFPSTPGMYKPRPAPRYS